MGVEERRAFSSLPHTQEEEKALLSDFFILSLVQIYLHFANALKSTFFIYFFSNKILL